MSTNVVNTSVHTAINISETAQNNVAAKIAEDSTSDIWAFGASAIRVKDGQFVNATQEEILQESKSTPSAMVRVLGTGADLLRFDANGHYAEDVAHIRALEIQPDKSAEEISDEIREAVENLRNKMRADIETGVFSVNEAGQVSYNPTPGEESDIYPQILEPEVIGFEMNALLIESITKKVAELNALNQELSDVFTWATENPGNTLFKSYTFESPFNSDRHIEIQSPEDFYEYTHPLGIDMSDYYSLTGDVDKLWEEISVFSEAAGEEYTNDPDYIASLVDKYARLLDVSSDTSDWRTVHDNTTKVDFAKFKYDYSPDDSSDDSIRYISLYREDRISIDTIQLEANQETLRARIKTLSDVSEQVATNFKVDNARFNNLLEAINSYNKAVMDTLRRFSVI